MAEDILHDIARIRRLAGDAARDQGNGMDVGPQLASILDELTHLLEKAEARLEDIERESLDARTRFVADIAAGFVRAMMAARGGALMGSEVAQAADMAAEVVKHVKARI